jgi:hypothetical protein
MRRRENKNCVGAKIGGDKKTFFLFMKSALGDFFCCKTKKGGDNKIKEKLFFSFFGCRDGDG